MKRDREERDFWNELKIVWAVTSNSIHQNHLSSLSISYSNEYYSNKSNKYFKWHINISYRQETSYINLWKYFFLHCCCCCIFHNASGVSLIHIMKQSTTYTLPLLGVWNFSAHKMLMSQQPNKRQQYDWFIVHMVFFIRDNSVHFNVSSILCY